MYFVLFPLSNRALVPSPNHLYSFEPRGLPRFARSHLHHQFAACDVPSDPADQSDVHQHDRSEIANHRHVVDNLRLSSGGWVRKDRCLRVQDGSDDQRAHELSNQASRLLNREPLRQVFGTVDSCALTRSLLPPIGKSTNQRDTRGSP